MDNRSAFNDRARLIISDSYIVDDARPPSGRERDESEGEEEAGERLDRAADGEHGAADAAAAAQGHQCEEISDHLQRKEKMVLVTRNKAIAFRRLHEIIRPDS